MQATVAFQELASVSTAHQCLLHVEGIALDAGTCLCQPLLLFLISCHWTSSELSLQRIAGPQHSHHPVVQANGTQLLTMKACKATLDL